MVMVMMLAGHMEQIFRKIVFFICRFLPPLNAVISDVYYGFIYSMCSVQAAEILLANFEASQLFFKNSSEIFINQQDGLNIVVFQYSGE